MRFVPRASAGAPKSLTDDLSLLVGQLMAATEAAADGLQALGKESHANASAIVAIAKTLETVERSIVNISCLIHDSNGDSLITKVKMSQAQVIALSSELGELTTKVDGLQLVLTELQTERQRREGARVTVVAVVQVVAWVLAMAVAVAALVWR